MTETTNIKTQRTLTGRVVSNKMDKTIAECRPLSRRKSWRLVTVLERAS